MEEKTFYVERTETGVYSPITYEQAMNDFYFKGFSYCKLLNGPHTIILLFWSLYLPAPKEEAINAIEEYFDYVYKISGNRGSMIK